MKFTSTLLLVVFIAVSGIAQEFTQKPVIFKRTAEWCPFCGQWGWEFMKAIEDEISAEQATIMAVHFDGELENDVSLAMSKEIEASGQPVFFLNDTKISANSSNWEDKLEELKTDVEDLNNTAADWAIDLNVRRTGNNYAGTVFVSAANAVEGEFSVGTYLISNDREYTQAGLTGEVEHPKLLVGNFYDDIYGQAMNGNSFAAGTYEFEYSKDFEEEGKSFDVAVIIWKKEGDEYSIVNSGVLEHADLWSSVNEANNNLSGNSFLRDANTLAVEIDTEKSLQNYTIKVVGLNGITYLMDNGIHTSGKMEREINVSDLSSGTYVVRVETENGTMTDKIVIAK